MDRTERREHARHVLSIVDERERAHGAQSDGPEWLVRSWRRSLQAHKLDPCAPAVRRVYTAGEVRATWDRLDLFREVARPHVEDLFRQVQSAEYCVVVTDADGLTIDLRAGATMQPVLRRAGVVLGTVWAERDEGTCGIGTAIEDRRAVLVHKAEHFRVDNLPLSCSAAPILGPDDELVAVLDASTLHSPYGRDSQSLVFEMVADRAQAIENAYVARLRRTHWRLWLARGRDPGIGRDALLIAFDDAGRVSGANRCAREQLLARFGARRDLHVDELLDRPVQALLAAAHRAPGLALPVRVGPAGEPMHALLRAPEPAAGPACAFALTGSTALGLADALTGSTAPGRADALGASTASGPAATCAGACAPGSAGAPAAPRGAWAEPLPCMGDAFDSLVLGDPRMHANAMRARRLADRALPIMLLGETGCGKELFARAIHSVSARRARAFVAVNCAAIPESLIESELFGYREGAFTGARARGAAGKLQQASGGTLFLDEIGDMPLPLQSRLLRVLAEGEVLPLGATEPVRVELRVVCATHQDLEALVRQGRFREDLYYRLEGAVLRLPALRERQDVGALIRQVLDQEAAAAGLGPVRLDDEALAAMLAHPWPGNVRQLRHALRHACALAEGDRIGLDCLPASVARPSVAAVVPAAPLAPVVPVAPVAPADAPAAPADGVFESDPAALRERMLAALAGSGWRVSAATRALGMPRSTFYRKMEAFGIAGPTRLLDERGVGAASGRTPG